MAGVRNDHAYTWRYGWSWIASYLQAGHVFAAMRQVYWALVRGYDGEACWFCGRPYMLWSAPDDLWAEFSGNSGLCCPACFDKRAERAGVALHWKPERFRDYVARCNAEQAPAASAKEPEHIFTPCIECERPVDIGTYSPYLSRRLIHEGVLHNECAENRRRFMDELDAYMAGEDAA